MAGIQKNNSGKDIDGVVEDLYREFLEKILPKLVEIHDESKRYLYFIAWLNKTFEQTSIGRIVVTGGFAVEIYTGRIYRTMDVDIIVEGDVAGKVLERFLERFSERIGRGYLPTYEIMQLKSIDIVSTVYTRKVMPTKVEIDGLYVYLDPVEELIVTYLAGWKYWGSTEDRDKAYWLYAIWRDRIDHGYLSTRARENNVEDYLELLKSIQTP
ncbi:hypothetical protein ACSU1N_03520 [Thermogladius sp. 4427co]|uniref:hypothetical protein n=1 Tax=Thermogladius sp. 4427co TaxID=3450718 RepID=UPI003F798822